MNIAVKAQAQSTQRVVLDITGMTCAACSARVETVLKRLPGVETASVNLALERADITAAIGGPTAPDLVEAIERSGFGATVRSGSAAERRMKEEAVAAERRAEERRTLVLFAAAALLTLPLVLPMLLKPLGLMDHLSPWTELALATPVQFLIGARFYRGAFAALRNGAGNMDVLVALGTTAAYLFSVWMVWQHGAHAHGHLYFEGAATVITLVLFGKWLEARAKSGTTAAIRTLMTLRPQSARVRRAGSEIDLPIDQVLTGDVVIVRPGERFPVDGHVIAGASEADESLVTGESVPVVKRTGDKVTAGSVNGTGLLEIAASAVGEDTTLERIIRLVEAAQTGKAPVQKLVDKVSAIFVPVVVLIALATFAGWFLVTHDVERALVAAVSVLVIACPCALGLAAPAALVTGTGAAARAGILVKDIEALERAATVDTVLIDKTGTLTTGHPALVAAIPLGGHSRADILTWAAALQSGSEHPLAKAILDAAKVEDIAVVPAGDIRAIVGEGIEGRVAGARLALGNRDLMARHGVAMETVLADIARLEGEAATAVTLARDGMPVAIFGLADPLRPESAPAVAHMLACGLHVEMLTGDAVRVAEKIGRDLKLPAVRAGLKPADKVVAVAEAKAKGRHVAMVGDGINDAPALAAADLGIAIGSGTDVAMAAAGITLMRPDPRLIQASLDIARRTVGKIRQNLFWAFVYNVVGIPLAAFGFLTPAVAGAAMALSSVSVVTNSLLLRRWRPH
jgi:P-type Cu+ transporter